MLETVDRVVPRTTTDEVFDHLHKQILNLNLLPGARISEADIANQLGVSRQPVRDAFYRLANLQLLKIRPQRATTVAGFSIPEVENARFVRLAVELEVARFALNVWDDACIEALEANLELQRAAENDNLIDQFHRLDYDFHKLICTLSGHPLAFKTIVACKQQVDRLCVLSLASADEAQAVLADHEEIAQALANKSAEDVDRVLRRHFGRLDSVLRDIHDKHHEYFD